LALVFFGDADRFLVAFFFGDAARFFGDAARFFGDAARFLAGDLARLVAVFLVVLRDADRLLAVFFGAAFFEEERLVAAVFLAGDLARLVDAARFGAVDPALRDSLGLKRNDCLLWMK